MAVAFNKINQFVADVGNKIHNLGGDALKVMLTNVAPVAGTSKVFSDLTEITAQNGYSAGGAAVPSNAYAQVGGLATLTGSNVVFTGSGGSFGPFRYAVLYNSTPGSQPLVGWWDYGSSISVNNGETFTVNLSGGILTLQ